MLPDQVADGFFFPDHGIASLDDQLTQLAELREMLEYRVRVDAKVDQTGDFVDTGIG